MVYRKSKNLQELKNHIYIYYPNESNMHAMINNYCQ